MIGYLIKSMVCLLALLLVYHLLLEREKMHRFNRCFLLFSLVFSFAIPLLAFEIATEPPSILQLTKRIEVLSAQPAKYTPVPTFRNDEITTTAQTPAIPFLLIAYVLGASIMAFRLFRNLYLLYSKIKNNPQVYHPKGTFILLEDVGVPYSFFNYIFVNEQLYQSGNINETVYKHEQTHARQKHSVDILFIELLKIFFWFNPVLYFYKKAIQLNHEYLADDSVVSDSADLQSYQKLLLTLQSGEKNMKLASSIHYSITKKRIMMMTKNTTRLHSVLKKLALVPLMAALVFAFSIRTAPAQVQSMSLTELIEALDKKMESIDSLTAEEQEALSRLVEKMRKKLHMPPLPPISEPWSPQKIRKRFPFILRAPASSSRNDSIAIAQISKKYNRSVQTYLDIKPTEGNIEKLKATYKQIQHTIDSYGGLYMEISKKHKNNPPPPFLMPLEPEERIEAYFFKFSSPPKPPIEVDTTQLNRVYEEYHDLMKNYMDILPTQENKKELEGIHSKIEELNKELEKAYEKMNKDSRSIPFLIPMNPTSRMMVYYRQHPILAINNNYILNTAYEIYIQELKEYANTAPIKENARTLGIMYSQTKIYYNNWIEIFEKSNTDLELPPLPTVAWKRIKAHSDKNSNPRGKYISALKFLRKEYSEQNQKYLKTLPVEKNREHLEALYLMLNQIRNQFTETLARHKRIFEDSQSISPLPSIPMNPLNRIKAKS